jgi:hypothetical protein
MNVDTHVFWFGTAFCTSATLVIEAMLGYMKRSWYYKFGIPLPFTLEAVREPVEIVSTRSFYVRCLGAKEIAVRYRFLGNYAPSLLKAFVLYRDPSSVVCHVTLNWWFVFLLSASSVGIYLYGGLLVWFLLLLLAVVLVISQLQDLRSFLQSKAIRSDKGSGSN